MAEYSKLAQGSFVSPGSNVAIYLPFIPDKVEIWNLSAFNHQVSGDPAYALWNKYMAQGDASGYESIVVSSQNVMVASNLGPNGIFTFSKGLSFQYGPQIQISTITKANPPVVTTSNAHGLVTGNVVFLTGISGMQQMASIPFVVTVTSTTTFTIPWNTNQSSYTAISGAPTGAYVTQILYPFLYAPGVSVISAITLGPTTLVAMTTPHNLSVGSEVAFRIPDAWGTIQLNSLPDSLIPGSPMYGYVTSVPSSTSVVVNINSSSFTPFFSNMLTTAVPGLTPPQILAVGDINNGGTPYSGGALYPAPLVNGVSTINGPAIQGSFVNNTGQGFIIGKSLLTNSGNAIYWEASYHDYSYGTIFAANP